MAAAKFVGTMVFRSQGGVPKQYPVTVSDVNGEFYIFPDANNILNLPSNLGTMYLVDLILSGAGTDTSKFLNSQKFKKLKASIFANGKNTGELVQNGANLATNQSRLRYNALIA